MAFPDGTADFRSDTVTRPTPAMAAAMADAAVGDDVYGEDPTTNELEEECADALGKEAALFVPSGMMGNQIAIGLHTRPGDEVLCVDWAHIRNHESGAGSALSGVSFRTVGTDDGTITEDDVTAAATQTDYYLPKVTLLAWENTHNASGGRVVPVQLMESTSAAARTNGLAIHLDGARLWNAVAATGVPGARYAAAADTVMFCFSKGLGAPIGSILVGSADAISAGRALRKRLGGGMRQVGVIAAAAQIALRERDRLADDHVSARALADGLAQRYPEAVNPALVETNIVVVDGNALDVAPERLQEQLAEKGILVEFIKPGVLRFCTHRDVDSDDIKRILAAIDEIEPG